MIAISSILWQFCFMGWARTLGDISEKPSSRSRTTEAPNAMRTCRLIAPLVLVFLPLGFAASAEEAPTEAAEKERLETMKQQAADYEVTLEGSPAVRLSLHADPLLRFSNPVGGVTDGIVAMWKDGERPAVFAQVFQLKDGLWIHECQSLASARLTMRIGKMTRWQPEEGAQKFTPVPDAPRAAESAVQRLVQMKAIAGRFSAADDFRIHPGDPETSRYELRRMAKPVYRYVDKAHRVNDAAVFAFVHGTDPELFLLLENRPDGDKDRWYYALIPMTCWAVTAQLDG